MPCTADAPPPSAAGDVGGGGGGDIPEEKDGGDGGRSTDRLGVGGGYQSIPGAER